MNERYELLAPIAEGGLGTVFRAWDTQMGRAVAVKRIRADKALDGGAAAVDALIREARQQSALQHPNIVAVYDFGTNSGKVVTKAAMDAVEPVWLADGRHVICTFRNTTSRSLYLIDTESGKATRLSPSSLGNAWGATYLAP